MKRAALLLFLCACNTTMIGQDAPDIGIDADGQWLLIEFFSPT